MSAGIDWVCSENLQLNPAGSLVSVGAPQNAQRTVSWTWLHLCHIPMNASRVLGLSVILRAHYVSRLWCLSYHKTALSLCFIHTGLHDILQIYHLLLKLLCLYVCLSPPPQLWEALNYSWRPKPNIPVDLIVPFILCSLLNSFHIWWLRGMIVIGKERQRTGPGLEDFVLEE